MEGVVSEVTLEARRYMLEQFRFVLIKVTVIATEGVVRISIAISIMFGLITSEVILAAKKIRISFFVVWYSDWN